MVPGRCSLANESGQSRGGLFVLLGVLVVLAILAPGWYRARHPRPQIRVDNQGAAALSILYEGKTAAVEAGRTVEIRCEVGQTVELLVPGAAEKKSVFLVVPPAADRQRLVLEAGADRDGVLAAKWKGP